MCEVFAISFHRGPWHLVVKTRAEAAINDADGNTILVASEETASRIVTAVNAYPLLLADNHQMRASLRDARDRLRREHSDLPAIDDALTTISMALSDDMDDPIMGCAAL